MEILVTVAHPDDADILCGGTLAKHADRGDDVTIAYMTRGEYGGFDTAEAELAATREREAERAAEILTRTRRSSASKTAASSTHSRTGLRSLRSSESKRRT
jgi:LmbE family N-acetylglucosaminyl deacetylase